MAILTAAEYQELWTVMNRNNSEQTWDKQQINAALQAIEDRVRSPGTQNAISSDIEAVVPGLFTMQQKQHLFGSWCTSAGRRIGMK